MKNIYGVIMAGGGGTRFWPLSRNATPKQLLNLSGKDAMVNETATRLNKVIDKKNIFVITNAVQTPKIIQVSNGKILPENVFTEPSARNTAACIGYSAIKIIKEHGDGIMVVTPSDAFIKDENTYALVLEKAIETASSGDKLVTIGINPTFPATGYGYICYEKSNNTVKKVEKFVEKPSLEVAKEYLAQGNYVWNSGVFIWKASVILEQFKKFLPDIYSDLLKIDSAIGTKDERAITEEVYPSIRSISVDYGIMEKASDIYVVPGDFGWNDVGSWDMMGVLNPCDKNGNIAIGDTVTIDTKNSIVYSSKRLVATVGIENLVVVETEDAIMVCPKDRAQEVKKIVDELKNQGRKDLL